MPLRRLLRHPRAPLVVLLALITLHYVATRGVFQGKASGDGFFGFMYLPNLVFFHTLARAPSVRQYVAVLGRARSGLVANPCPIGPALFWRPPYLIGRALGKLHALVTHAPTPALPGQST